MQITAEKVVSFDYKLSDSSGNVLDTSEGREPLTYMHGQQEIIPGLEDALEGKSAGDEFRVEVPPAAGYGERNEAPVARVHREEFKDIPDLEIGMQFRVTSEEGPEQVVTIVEVGDEEVALDGNHPLAGYTLCFEIAVREVREATEDEKRGDET